jgi:hypothetical protein
MFELRTSFPPQLVKSLSAPAGYVGHVCPISVPVRTACEEEMRQNWEAVWWDSMEQR